MLARSATAQKRLRGRQNLLNVTNTEFAME
jgi:hypothetical protein